MLTASAASKDGSTLWSAHVISDGCQCLCCETPRDPSSTPRLSTTMSSSKMMLLPAKKKRRSPGILLGFFFLSLCFIFCNWHDSGRPHVISSWTDWDAHSLKTYMYYIFHCLIESENLLYGTMNRNFPIIWRDWRAKNQSQVLIDPNPSFMRDCSI